jgi:gamma-glutamylcyclotransferase (GGCT)/AIG2-like uncharacterized protein YtfP
VTASSLTRRIAAYAERDDLVVSFVYGTLRIGGGNHSWLNPEAMVDSVEDCTARGTLYVAGIPYVDFKHRDYTIHGDLVVLKATHPGTIHVSRVEYGAGYRAMMIPVTLPGYRRPTVRALAWHFQPTKLDHRHLTLVEDGDYLAERDREYEAWCAQRARIAEQEADSSSTYVEWWEDASSGV